MFKSLVVLVFLAAGGYAIYRLAKHLFKWADLNQKKEVIKDVADLANGVPEFNKEEHEANKEKVKDFLKEVD